MAGVVISTVVLVTFLFSGSILVRYAIPRGLLWMEYLSISFYTHQALAHNEFDGIVFDDGGTGRDFLKSQRLAVLNVWQALGALVLYTLICNIVGPIALHLTSRRG